MRRGTAQLSRTGHTSPLGKLTEQIPAVKISLETKERLETAAAQSGMPLQAFVRELLDIRAHGLDTVKKLHAHRLEVVSGKVEER